MDKEKPQTYSAQRYQPESQARFLRACHGLEVDATPVWFMRQAGRYLPEYQAIREKYTLLEICHNPNLAAEVTLQPVRRFDLDAAILFADILLPVTALGFHLEFTAGEGPRISPQIQSLADIRKICTFNPQINFEYLAEAIRIINKELGKIPLIGFCGAPFTVASYLLEGGSTKNFIKTKQWMFTAPAIFMDLMDTLVEVLIAYLSLQIDAGVQAVQIFDSWVGVLSPSDYERFVLPYSQRLIRAARLYGIPVIHFGTDTATLLPLMKKAGGDVMGVDWRIPLDVAWEWLGADWAVQGNLDPVALLAPRDELKAKVWEVLQRANGRPGHIFNLGHGILPNTPLDNVQAVVDWVHEFSAKSK
ncbi:MAG: uroporphyrinogen decarboxylase [Anaerolineales bacterium]